MSRDVIKLRVYQSYKQRLISFAESILRGTDARVLIKSTEAKGIILRFLFMNVSPVGKMTLT
jgi:hypothetical protein